MKDIIYRLTEEWMLCGIERRQVYGIALCTRDQHEGESTILSKVADISFDHDRLAELVLQCNRLALSPIHLYDVVEDFLAK